MRQRTEKERAVREGDSEICIGGPLKWLTEYSAEHREMRVCKAWQRTAIGKLGAAQRFQRSHRTGRHSSSNQSEWLNNGAVQLRPQKGHILGVELV